MMNSPTKMMLLGNSNNRSELLSLSDKFWIKARFPVRFHFIQFLQYNEEIKDEFYIMNNMWMSFSQALSFISSLYYSYYNCIVPFFLVQIIINSQKRSIFLFQNTHQTIHSIISSIFTVGFRFIIFPTSSQRFLFTIEAHRAYNSQNFSFLFNVKSNISYLIDM